MSGMTPTATGFGRSRSPWLLMLVLGFVEIVLGFIGLAYAPYVTVAMMFVFGILLMIGGGVQIARAIGSATWGGVWLHVLFAVLYEIVGVWLLVAPALAAEEITLLLAIFFVVTGVFRILGAGAAQYHGWAASLITGVVDLILGILLWLAWPASGMMFIGLCVAFDLLLAGGTWVAYAISMNRAQPAR